MEQKQDNIVVLRPQRKQFLVSNIHLIVLAIVMWLLYAATDFFMHQLFLWIAIVIVICLIYQYKKLRSYTFTITGEQIIVRHGIVSNVTDYIELYRVVDYRQRRTLTQQMAGLKTVTILSGDRNTPTLDIIGMRDDLDVVGYIRKKVEYNKKIHGIYEITNRA